MRSLELIKAEKRAYEKAWRLKNVERCRQYSRDNYAKNIERIREYRSKWNKANRAKKNAINKRWRERHPDVVKECNRREVENLSAAYVAKKMRLRVGECPPDLIELKRTHIQLQRQLRKTK